MVTLGVIADVQWADEEDGFNYLKTVKRCYRGAVETLGAAVDFWSAQDAPPKFIAQLGDLLDGRNAKPGNSKAAFDVAMGHFARTQIGAVHVVGNHELLNFTKVECRTNFASALNPSGKEYHSFVEGGVKFMVLDSFQENIILPGRPDITDATKIEITQTAGFKNALAGLQANNPNDVLSGANWMKGLEGMNKRWMPFNGGLGAEQLEWLKSELAESKAARQPVVIMSHVPFHYGACDGFTFIFDYEAALKAIDESGVVVAVLCGHDHRGGYCCSEGGVHHVTFQSPLNKGTDGHAYGLVTVFPDKLEIKGIALEDWLPYGKHENGTPLPGSDVLPKPQPTADGKMQFIELPVTMRA